MAQPAPSRDEFGLVLVHTAVEDWENARCVCRQWREWVDTSESFLLDLTALVPVRSGLIRSIVHQRQMTRIKDLLAKIPLALRDGRSWPALVRFITCMGCDVPDAMRVPRLPLRGPPTPATLADYAVACGSHLLYGVYFRLWAHKGYWFPKPPVDAYQRLPVSLNDSPTLDIALYTAALRGNASLVRAMVDECQARFPPEPVPMVLAQQPGRYPPDALAVAALFGHDAVLDVFFAAKEVHATSMAVFFALQRQDSPAALAALRRLLAHPALRDVSPYHCAAAQFHEIYECDTQSLAAGPRRAEVAAALLAWPHLRRHDTVGMEALNEAVDGEGERPVKRARHYYGGYMGVY